jgi:hypothetical protein
MNRRVVEGFSDLTSKKIRFDRKIEINESVTDSVGSQEQHFKDPCVQNGQLFILDGDLSMDTLGRRVMREMFNNFRCLLVSKMETDDLSWLTCGCETGDQTSYINLLLFRETKEENAIVTECLWIFELLQIFARKNFLAKSCRTTNDEHLAMSEVLGIRNTH